MEENTGKIQEFYTTEEVAALFKVNIESVRRWTRKGKLKAIKLGGKFIRISRTSIEKFIEDSGSDVSLGMNNNKQL